MSFGSGQIQPTRWTNLVGLALVGAGLGWVLVTVLTSVNGTAPVVPWTAVLALVVAAGLVAAAGWVTRRTVHVRRGYLPANQGVRLVLLAKASSIAGALVAGGYVGYAIRFLNDLEASLPRERLIVGLVAAVAAALLLAAGLFLERACRVPRDDSDKTETDR